MDSEHKQAVEHIVRLNAKVDQMLVPMMMEMCKLGCESMQRIDNCICSTVGGPLDASGLSEREQWFLAGAAKLGLARLLEAAASRVESEDDDE